jgi:hypothetical protein
VLSVGIGFTLQVVAQRHARPADSAIVLSSEDRLRRHLRRGFMGDRLGADGLAACALITRLRNDGCNCSPSSDRSGNER